MQNNIQSYESSDGDVKKILGVDANIHKTRKDARNEKNEISNQIQSALMNGMLNLSNFSFQCDEKISCLIMIIMLIS